MIKNTLLTLAVVFIGCPLLAQSNYKTMIDDPSINFYDVCAAADLYFETHDKGKGSGWVGYQRWKAENESKYFPSGDRSQADPRFAEKQYQKFVK